MKKSVQTITGSILLRFCAIGAPVALALAGCQQDPYPKSGELIDIKTASSINSARQTPVEHELNTHANVLDEAVLDFGVPATLKFEPEERTSFSIENLLLHPGNQIEAIHGLPEGANVDLGTMTLSWEPSLADAPTRSIVTFEISAAHLKVRKELILEVSAPTTHEEAL